MDVVRLLIGVGGQRLLSLTSQIGFSPLHLAAGRRHIDMSRLLVDRGGKRLLAAKTNNGETAEDVAMRLGLVALAGMLRRARVAKAGSDVWGKARPRMSAEVEALASARAAAAMAELLEEEEVWRPRPVAAVVEGPRGAAREGRVWQEEVRGRVARIRMMDRASSLLVWGVADPPQAAAGVSWCVCTFRPPPIP